MVVGAFPIAKLSGLLIKQISKPIANVCKESAKNSPFFRTYVCMPPAQFYNWCEVKSKMWILNLGKPVNIPVLSEQMAIELGANLLGEGVIFIIGAALLIFEYNRYLRKLKEPTEKQGYLGQSKKEQAKEQKREDDYNHIVSTITDLYFTVQQQQTQLREIERIIGSISDQKVTTPPPIIKEPDLKPPSPPSAVAPVEPLPAAEEKKPETNCKNEIKNTEIINTPYPNKGVILQSLNYIQMDVFSSFFCNYKFEIDSKSDQNPAVKRRGPALLTEALCNIENNFRSLF